MLCKSLTSRLLDIITAFQARKINIYAFNHRNKMWLNMCDAQFG